MPTRNKVALVERPPAFLPYETPQLLDTAPYLNRDQCGIGARTRVAYRDEHPRSLVCATAPGTQWDGEIEADLSIISPLC